MTTPAGRGGRQTQDGGLPPHVLREYAFLADGHRGALIGPRGDISWLCVPSWDSDAVFADLLGGRGRYTVTPADPRFVWGGYYQPGSLIWTSRWVTTHGIIHCQEALAFPGDARRAVLLRRVRAIEGEALVTVTLDPRAGFGRHPMRDGRRHRGVWSARTGGVWLRWTGAAGARPNATGALCQRLRVPAGEHYDLILELADHDLDNTTPLDPDQVWRDTEHAWEQSDHRLPDDCLGSRDADHALAVLRGMTVPNGGMVAAATTSLPERAEVGRDYDYRYAWIRDQCFAGQAAVVAGADDLVDAAVSFVTDRLLADGPDLAPAYTAATHQPVPPQRQLDFLPGYPGAPVRTGNWVRGQFQLDVFGEILLLLSAAGVDRLNSDAGRAVRVAVDTIAQRWTQPDAGVWELEPRQWTHSTLTCVAGLRAAAGTATGAEAARWMGLADTILAHTARSATHPSGRWQRAADDPRVDAALLLPIIRGALPPGDPRAAATLDAVRRDLERDGYVYRFRPDQRPLGEAEGAFLLCGLAAALANHQAGNRILAARWFERNRAACGPAGLYAEEYDVRQRQLRGNLPQAFVHALLLEATVRLGD